MKKFVLSLILSTSALQAADIDLRTWEPMSQTPAPSQRAMGLEEALSDLSTAVNQLAKVLVPATSQANGAQKSGIGADKQRVKLLFLETLRVNGVSAALDFAQRNPKGLPGDTYYALPSGFLNMLETNWPHTFAIDAKNFVEDSYKAEIVYDRNGIAYIARSGGVFGTTTYTKVYYNRTPQSFFDGKTIDRGFLAADPIDEAMQPKPYNGGDHSVTYIPRDLLYRFPIA